MSLPYDFRLRQDLVIQPQENAGGAWVVKDPISLRFFLLGADEHFILERLNGRHTAEQIIAAFARQRAPKKLTPARLQAFLSHLYRCGLASSAAPHQSRQLLEREDSQRWQESVLGWTNLLAIRLPGCNPDRWLDRVYPALRWCFSWWWMVCWLLITVGATSLAVAHWEALAAEFAQIDEFVSGRNLIWLAAALAGTKVLHELAHALTCKHFGGRCHELGLMLLVFTPCLYCNVSDAWMLRSRTQRILISAAGILVELCLASLAIILWRFTYPGALHAISLNIILVCSVGTLLFNGNPLLKYDGYYILSDLVRVPNLWQESRSRFFGLLSKLFVRLRTGGPVPPLSRDAFLNIYAIMSMAYRLALTGAILLFLRRVLHPRGLDVLWWLVVVAVAGHTIYALAAPVKRWTADPTGRERLKKGAVALGLLSVALAAAVVASVQLPCRITGPAVIEPRDQRSLFVATPGILMEGLRPGAVVEAGQPIARLDNMHLRLEQLRIEGELRRAQARVQMLEARVGDDPTAAAQRGIVAEMVDDLTEQSRLRQQEHESLTLKAPIRGTIIAPPKTAPSGSDSELPTWSGPPLSPGNVGCRMERGTLVCLVSALDRFDAVVFVDETEVPFVRPGQPTRVRLEHAIAEELVGRVVEISELSADETPPELVALSELTVRTDRSGRRTPVRTLYQVRVELDERPATPLVGARAKVQIEVAPQTIFQRTVRLFQRTVRTDGSPVG